MKLILFLLKYTPFVLAALMVLHNALLLRGIDIALARLVVMCAGVALLSGFLTSRIYERKRGTECCACGNCGSGE